MRRSNKGRDRPYRRVVDTAITLLAVSACVTGTGGGGLDGTASPASDAEWVALATPRQVPLPEASRISIGEIDIFGGPPWVSDPLLTELGLPELLAAGLLRRADVHYVERRRFSAAVEAERAGELSHGAPRAGVSPGAEMVYSAVWVATPSLLGSLELRLVDTQTGSVISSWRTPASNDADPVALARLLVGTLIEELDRLGRLPSWEDPMNDAAPESLRSSGVPASAVRSFLTGLASEEVWDWEAARRGYQEALADRPNFIEASTALARTARLRQGGTLGES